ncbi:OmpA family protein [Granulosicoccus sp.]|nr:OmpA family protein [Granulosicoccus sp.]MDB4224483.1 OmpA family protein [Granulosicoccus sp.]
MSKLMGNKRYSRTSVVGLSLLAALTATGCSSLGSTQLGFTDSDAEPESAQAISDDQHRVGRHVYVATGVGASHLDPDTSELTTYDVNDRVNAGGQITFGMDVSRQLAVELHSADLGSAGLSPSGRINYHLHGASALVYAGKNRDQFKRRGLTGYGRIGLGMLENSAVGDVPYVQDNSTHLLLGAGVEYMTKMGLGLRAELISYEEDAQYGQLALVYRMGKKPRREAEKLVEVEEEVLEPVVAAAVESCTASTPQQSSVYFATDSSDLDAEGMALLATLGEELQACEELKVRLAGHTDSVGADAYNQALSQRRVESVMQPLSKNGIESTRIEANGMGEGKPAASNETGVGRSLNRRVEIVLN